MSPGGFDNVYQNSGTPPPHHVHLDDVTLMVWW